MTTNRITFEPPSQGVYGRKAQTEWTLLVDFQPVATLHSRQAMERLETALAELAPKSEVTSKSGLHHCTVCGDETTLACSDCQIDLRTTVYVCAKTVCQRRHEEKCPHVLKPVVKDSDEYLKYFAHQSTMSCNIHSLNQLLRDRIR